MTDGRLETILIKRMRRGPMDPAPAATLVAGRGIAGNANQGGRRQVTLLDLDEWTRRCATIGLSLDPAARRANLVLTRLALCDTRGRVLRVGSARLRILGETKPCRLMNETARGLEAALWPEWGGGAFAEVLAGGEIRVGAPVWWEETEQLRAL